MARAPATKPRMTKALTKRPKISTTYDHALGLELCEAVANNMSIVSWCRGHSHEDKALEAKIKTLEGEELVKAQADLAARRDKRALTRPGYRTVMIWQTEQDLFLVQMTLASEHRADFQFEEMVTIADDHSLDVRERDIMIRTRQWTSARMNRKKYGDRVDLVAPTDAGDDNAKLAEFGALLAKAAGKVLIGEGVKALEKMGVTVSSTPQKRS